MKTRFAAAIAVFAITGLAATAGQPRAVTLSVIGIQKKLDDRFAHISPDEPFFLLGTTRGVYLDGYGAVFTAELNLVQGPNHTPFGSAPITKEIIARHRQKKLERIPKLRAEMRIMLAQTAAALDGVPDNEQVVLVVDLTKYPWEDTSGIPCQIIVQGQKSALAAAAAGGGAQLATVIKSEEY